MSFYFVFGLFIDCLFFILNLRFSHFVIKCIPATPPHPLSTAYVQPFQIMFTMAFAGYLLYPVLVVFSDFHPAYNQFSIADFGKLETNIKYIPFLLAIFCSGSPRIEWVTGWVGVRWKNFNWRLFNTKPQLKFIFRKQFTTQSNCNF